MKPRPLTSSLPALSGLFSFAVCLIWPLVAVAQRAGKQGA